jgi:hypothetical protein
MHDERLYRRRGGERYGNASGAERYSGARVGRCGPASFAGSDWFLLYLNAMSPRR